jgi:hypothetical protein
MGAKMSQQAPRYVPLISGLVCLAGAISVLVFWTAPSGGLLYWIRGAVFGGLAWLGIWDLKVATFATDGQIRRATSANDDEVWRERGVAAASVFRLKDILFISLRADCF